MRTTLLTLAALVGLASFGVADERRAEYQRELDRGREAIEATRYDDAVRALERCIELEPRDALAAFEIARARAMQRRNDDALTWLERSVEWGIGNRERGIERLTEDRALANVRSDARVAKLVERARTLRREVDEYTERPSIYRPRSLENAQRASLLIVLHDHGSTREDVIRGRWREVADELGMVLVAPSGRRALHGRPEEGMAFYRDEADFTRHRGDLIHPILSVFDAVKQQGIETEAAVVIAKGRAAAVAIDLFIDPPDALVDRPGRGRGLVLIDGDIFDERTRQRISDRTPMVSSHMRNLAMRRVAQSEPEFNARVAHLRGRLGDLGLPSEVREAQSVERDPAAWRRAIVETVRSMELRGASPAGVPR